MKTLLERDRLFVGGAWFEPSTAETIDVVSPSTEAVAGRVPAVTTADVDGAVSEARRAFGEGVWRSEPPAIRAAALRRIAEHLRARQDELARLVTTELGIPIESAAADHVAQPIGTLEYYADLTERFAFDEPRADGRRQSLVVHQPVGVVAAIVPWNAPLRSTLNKLAPALAAGCSIVVKSAPDTPLGGYALADAIEAAGLPSGVVSILAAGREAGEHLVTHPGIDKISFTGSSATGRHIMAAAATNLTRVTLELGGKSAAIVLDDADLDATLRRLVPMALGNSGQACTAMTRLLVSRALHDEFVERLCDAVRAWPVGDPFDTATKVGPLVSAAHRDRVLGYIDLAHRAGAKAVLGGGRPAHLERGYYVEPTVLTGVTNDMRVAREEIFGPVVSVLAYDDLEDAIGIANDSDFGLSGSVWTSDVEAGVGVARRIRTGQVRVNGAAPSSEAPFGGFKRSGIGREYGPEGLLTYLESQAISYRPA